MLTCEQALELISAQLDGALTAGEAGALDEHLAQCPACRALRADLSTLHQLLPTLAEEPPAGLKDNIMKAVYASKCTPFHTRKRQWRWRSWASLAAVLVLVLVGGQAVHLWSPPDSSGSVPRANLAGLTGAASGGSAGQTAPAQEDRAGPTGEPAEAASFTLLKEQLVEVLSTLTPREEKVLKLRFGIEDGRTRTLEEVGKEFNVTRERIRQIEAKALRKLRHPSRSKKLKDFLN